MLAWLNFNEPKALVKQMKLTCDWCCLKLSDSRSKMTVSPSELDSGPGKPCFSLDIRTPRLRHHGRNSETPTCKAIIAFVCEKFAALREWRPFEEDFHRSCWCHRCEDYANKACLYWMDSFMWNWSFDLDFSLFPSSDVILATWRFNLFQSGAASHESSGSSAFAVQTLQPKRWITSIDHSSTRRALQ